MISAGEQLLLIAFNPLNKENGFYSLKVGQQEGPRLLTMGPYLYYWPFVANRGKLPLKASAADLPGRADERSTIPKRFLDP